MADSKKYDGSQWEHSLRKLGTATDTITTLPADIYADGTNATVGLKGNMYQASGVSPDTPIQPQECGDRTGNSFNINGTYTTQGSNSVSNNQINAKCAGSNESYMWFDDTILSGTYKLSLQFNDGLRNVRILCSKAFSGGTYNSYYGGWYAALNNGEITITVSEDFKIGFNFIGDAGATGTVYNIMFSTDTNADYEPYGYKIPISSANTTTPVYLGEVQTTRQIKKLVFDGTENWRQSVNGAMYLSPFTGESYKKEVAITSMNSHFAVQINTTSGTNQVGDNSSCFLAASGSAEYYIGARSYATATDFKTYLAQQYSNGTPVCVWYVLATPQTAVVNEPIRKIGDYADTVSGITIPTITGADSFDVLTTLKPSEVELAYTGWHDASVKGKSENLFDTFDIVGQVPTIGTGELIGYNGSTTSLIPINSGLLTLTKQQGILIYLMLYASDKSYIGYTANSEAEDMYGSSVTGYENAEYCRVRIDRKTELDTIRIMLNTGNTALPYEPYWK